MIQSDVEYKKSCKIFVGMMSEIRKSLAQHKKRQSKNRFDWGYVGDISHAYSELADILIFLMPPTDPIKKIWMNDEKAGYNLLIEKLLKEILL